MNLEGGEEAAGGGGACGQGPRPPFCPPLHPPPGTWRSCGAWGWRPRRRPSPVSAPPATPRPQSGSSRPTPSVRRAARLGGTRRGDGSPAGPPQRRGACEWGVDFLGGPTDSDPGGGRGDTENGGTRRKNIGEMKGGGTRGDIGAPKRGTREARQGRGPWRPTAQGPATVPRTNPPTPDRAAPRPVPAASRGSPVPAPGQPGPVSPSPGAEAPAAPQQRPPERLYGRGRFRDSTGR